MSKKRMAITALLAACAAIVLNACRSSEELDFERYYSNGQRLYQEHCQNCHGADGKGLGQLIPSLSDTVFLKNNQNRLSCIVKNGMEGKITVSGKEFNEKMPAHNTLADIEVAELVTYIGNSFGNKQGLLTAAEAGMDLKACSDFSTNSLAR